MKKYEKRQVEKNELVDVVCDFCGESCKIDFNFEFSALFADWGYGSLHDGEMWEYTFCIKCSEKLLEQIKDRRL